jgi:hypothetical protein
MSLQSRVRKITLDLTPEQHAMNYVASTKQQHKSFSDYTRSYLTGLEPPLDGLCEQVSDSVRDAMPEAEEKEVALAVREAVRQTVFLCFLYDHVTYLMSEEEMVLSLLSQLTEETLGRMLSTSTRRKPSVDSYDESVLKDRAASFVKRTRSLALRFYAVSAAVKSIEESYFKGTALPFDSSAATMKEIRRYLEIGTNLYNSVVAGRHPGASATVDLKNLRAASCDGAQSISDDLVAVAEVDALLYVGDQEGARRILRGLRERRANSRGNVPKG